MIDALDRQMAPVEKELRAYARRQAGCKALMAHYGIGELTQSRSSRSSATAPGSPLRARRSGTPGWTSPCTSPTSGARPGTSRARGRRRCAGRCSRPPSQPADRPALRTTTAKRGAARHTGVYGGRTQAPEAQLPHPARARRGGIGIRMTFTVAPSPHRHRCAAASSRQCPAATTWWTALKDRAADASPSGVTQSNIMSPARANPGRGPKQGWAPARTRPAPSTAHTHHQHRAVRP